MDPSAPRLSPAAITLDRFGLGAWPDDPMPADPRAWVLDQFARFDAQPARFAALPDAGALLDRYRRERMAARAGGADGAKAAVQAARRNFREKVQALYREGVQARADAALATETPFLVGRLYAAGQALFVHAVASPYRDRSHFDGQNVLETGGTRPYAVRDGWLNRLVATMPRAAEEAIAITSTLPTALRGPVPVASYAPSALPAASDDLMARVGALYGADPQLHAPWVAALEARGLAVGSQERGDAAGLGRLAASFLVKPDGPRIAMLETLGWDTHSGQKARLANQLRNLDALLATLRDGLGAA